MATPLEEFREWLRVTFPGRWEELFSQAVSDSFKSGGLEANNDLFRQWVEIGRPLGTEPGQLTERALTVLEDPALAEFRQRATPTRQRQQPGITTAIETALGEAPPPEEEEEELPFAFGQLPSDVTLVAPGVFFSPSLNKYYDENTEREIDRSFAFQIIARSRQRERVEPSERTVRLAESLAATESAQLQRLTAGPGANLQQLREDEFERARESILKTLTNPADFIKRFTAQNAPNPFTVTQPTPTNIAGQLSLDVGSLDQQILAAQGEATRFRGAAIRGGATEESLTAQSLLESVDESINISMDEALRLSQLASEGARTRVGTVASNLLQTTQKNLDKLISERKKLAEQLGTLDQPGEFGLPQFAPPAQRPVLRTPQSIAALQTGVSPGDPLRLGQALETPGGQQLARLTPTGAAQISGFAEAAGGRSFADILEQARIQLPRAPRVGRRTTAARQRV